MLVGEQVLQRQIALSLGELDTGQDEEEDLSLGASQDVPLSRDAVDSLGLEGLEF